MNVWVVWKFAHPQKIIFPLLFFPWDIWIFSDEYPSLSCHKCIEINELFNCLLFPLFLLLIPFWKISSNTQHNLAKFSLSSVTTMFFVLNSRTNPAKYKNIYDSNVDLLQKSDWCFIARSITIRSTEGVSPFYVQLNIRVLHHCQKEQLMHEVMHTFIYLYPPLKFTSPRLQLGF